MPKRLYCAMPALAVILSGITTLPPTPSFAAEIDPGLHYIGSVEFFPETASMNAGWTIIVKDRTLDQIEFKLNASLGGASVTGPASAGVTSALESRFDDMVRRYSVNLHPAIDGSDRVLKFSYSGPLFPPGVDMAINTLDRDKIELTVESFWFPFDARFDTQLTAQVSTRLSGDWTPVGVDQVKTTSSGYRFIQRDPAIDISLALLSDAKITRAKDYTIYDARPEPGARLSELTEMLGSCTAYLNALAGPAGPLPKASVMITDRPEGGYSRGTLIALTDIEYEDEESLRQFICHELAHYWSKANAGGPENWLNEGLADYLAAMAIREIMGEAVFTAKMARYEDQIKGQHLPPIWTDEATERRPYLTLYRAGPLAFRDLELQMGRAPFAQLIQRMMAEGVRNTRECLTLIEEASGAEIRDWFEARLSL